eukprot:799423-Alexandrium_andersonii.AAC.1
MVQLHPRAAIADRPPRLARNGLRFLIPIVSALRFRDCAVGLSPRRRHWAFRASWGGGGVACPRLRGQKSRAFH